ncbi:cyanophycin synthetase [Duganella aceris]|uniref:Cyanophycin synthetase n=1 Tax=Duganella aceris TaxID=2703883 RepID=A0ABX0FLD8_9BURK|nr:cyanophycin synthetase [Duganella aceris]NGZ85327.1 cyanophycin synthetase [Duganella aceris]
MTKKKDIEVLRVTHLRGPNIWTYRPVIEAWLDIGELESFPSNLLPGLYERLTAILPGLIVHRCGVGEHGGFLERLRDGTYAGHILEHVVLELQNLAGMKTGFGKTRQIGEDTGLYKMAFRTRQEQVGRAALAHGRDLLMAMIDDQPYDLEAVVAELTDMVESLCLGPSTANIVDAAGVRQIPFIRLTDGNLVQLGHGAAQRRIWTAETEETSAIAEGIASDKDLTKSLLSSCGVPVPEGELVTSAEAAWEAARDIGVPVVVKPYDGNHGRGVSLNLMTESDVTAAYALAARKGESKSVIVERFIPGDEHRLLVVGKRLIAAAAGESLWVTGDGKSTVLELCDIQINVDPRRGETEDFPLGRIKPHESAEIILELQRQNMTHASVPADGQKVLIQPNGNVATDVTDKVHPQVAAMATLAARIVGLDIAGIDLVTSDISRPLHEQGGAVIEVNASPGLLAHLKPASGEPRNVGEAIVDHLFAPEHSGRMPIVGITGKHGTTMASRLIAWLLQISGKKVGLTCADGLFVNGRLLPKDGFSDWETGERLLLNKNVEAGVFEASARMILTEGLAYDKCAVGVVTDVSDFDDLGEFYIDSADKLYGVLRTQVDVILPSGVAVLNAADPQVVDMARLCDGEVIFYGVDEHSAAIAEHRQDGKRVVFQRTDAQSSRIVLAIGHDQVANLPLSPLVPPEAVLAAIAAGWALGLTPELIGAGLRTFDANPKKTHH